MSVLCKPGDPPSFLFGNDDDDDDDDDEEEDEFEWLYNVTVRAARGRIKNDVNYFIHEDWFDENLDNETFAERVVWSCENFYTNLSEDIEKNGMHHRNFISHVAGLELMICVEIKKQLPSRLHTSFNLLSIWSDLDYEYTQRYRLNVQRDEISFSRRLFNLLYLPAVEILGPLSDFFDEGGPHELVQFQDYQGDLLETMVNVFSESEMVPSILFVFKQRLQLISSFWLNEAKTKRNIFCGHKKVQSDSDG